MMTSLHLLFVDASHQLPNADVVRPDGVQGSQGALQHMIAPPEGPRLFEGQEIGRALDHTDLSRLPPGVGANGAELAIGEMKTFGTGVHAPVHLPDQVRQGFSVFLRALEQVHGDAGSAFFSQTREFAQSANEVPQNRWVGVHGFSDPS